MLSILLLILKIIGFILLGLIGLLLGIILIVLFIPIKYRIEGTFVNNGLIGNGKVTWLFRIFSIELYQNEKDSGLIMKLFGKRINKKKKSTTATQEIEEVIKKEVSVDKLIDKEEATKKVTIQEIKEDSFSNSDSKENFKNTKSRHTQKKRKSNKKKKKRSKDQWKIWDRIKQVKDFLSDETNKQSIRKIKNTFIDLLKSLSPKKITLYLKVGTGDPATTGYLLGALSILYGLKGKTICIEGDFYQQVFEGRGKLRGKIYLYSFVKGLIQLLLDKKIRQWIILTRN